MRSQWIARIESFETNLVGAGVQIEGACCGIKIQTQHIRRQPELSKLDGVFFIDACSVVNQDDAIAFRNQISIRTATAGKCAVAGNVGDDVADWRAGQVAVAMRTANQG